ncbi:MAG: SAM-dependent methyltransferase [Candidatus Scalindua sp.]|jgi:SAM-dependent MidA family methyltransferase|nr:SAM-dependent methyltransferase [Candidatus Scalindua sp.]MDV5166364.1 SAM-dependent methyltransferase [Candidatus Scalindua sp.]
MYSSDLEKEIVDLINVKGKITFADFMELALYHPEHGYYASGKEKIGKRGDYYTSSDVHSVFGELVARQLEQMWRLLGSGRFSVVEIGAGKGWLCHDILNYIKNEYQEFYEKIEYKIVEISRDLIKRQSDTLKGFEEKVSWESFSEGKLSFNPIEGCFLSNEFVDSLPVHQVIVEDNCLKEIYVATTDGVLSEKIDGLSNPELENYFKELNINLRDGQRAEINLKALDWVKNISLCLNRGFVITIDYGHLAEDLYSEERHRGTLICYYEHTTSENPYGRVGNQDITSHVNFSSIMEEGIRSGLSTTGFVRQSTFLIALGILNKMNDVKGDISKLLTMKNLFLPGGMGDMFKVLIQHKGIDNPELIGLRSMSEPGLAKEIEGY